MKRHALTMSAGAAVLIALAAYATQVPPLATEPVRPVALADTVWRPDSTMRDTLWRDSTWRDTTWRDTTWRDTTWRDTTARDTTIKPMPKPKEKKPKPPSPKPRPRG